MFHSESATLISSAPRFQPEKEAEED